MSWVRIVGERVAGGLAGCVKQRVIASAFSNTTMAVIRPLHLAHPRPLPFWRVFESSHSRTHSVGLWAPRGWRKGPHAGGSEGSTPASVATRTRSSTRQRPAR